MRVSIAFSRVFTRVGTGRGFVAILRFGFGLVVRWLMPAGAFMARSDPRMWEMQCGEALNP